MQVPEDTRHLLVAGAGTDLDIAASVYWHNIGAIEGSKHKLTDKIQMS